MEEPVFHLRFRSTSDPDYIKEQEELKKDTSWHLCHDFIHSYFWMRHSDGAHIYFGDLHKRGIVFTDFPQLDKLEIEKLVIDINEEAKKLAEWRKANPIKIPPFDAITMSKFTKAIPDLDINDLVGVQPIQR